MTEPHQNRHPRPAEAGFTLVEIMVVIVILGLIATMVAKNVIGAGDTAREQTTMGNLSTVHQCVEMYASMTGKLPGSLEELQSEEAKTKAWYLRDEPKDGWGNPLILRGDSKRDFEIVSFGADGLENTEDDLSSIKKKE